MATKATKAEKARDKEIEAAFYATCEGVPVNIMDIPKIFAYGRRVHAEGKDLRVEIPRFVATLAK